MVKRIIIGPGYPLRGGISESNEGLCDYFQANNQDCKIVSYSLQYPYFLFPGKQQTIENVSSVRNHTISLINTINPLSWMKSIRWIISEKPDYVIVRYWHPYFSICLSFILSFLNKRSIFVIAWIDNIFPHEPVPFQYFLTSYFLNSCDAFVVMSKSVHPVLTSCFHLSHKKISITSHPTYSVFGQIISKNLARQKIELLNSLPITNRCILFFGLVRKYKGLDLLLDTMALERIRKMDIKLIIAGEFYDSKEKYLAKIDKLNIGENIIIHDYYIPNEHVGKYICAADIIVQPYISATQSGVSMIAYNFDKPMILTNVGGLAEYVQDGVDGYLVPPNSNAIASALEDYYMNNREPDFVQAVKKKKINYSWEKLAMQFDNLYKFRHE